jgi:hypothetical protein
VWAALDIMIADGEVKQTGTTRDRRLVWAGTDST